MNANVFDKTMFNCSLRGDSGSTNAKTNEEDTYSIPICMDDIISICKEFSKLGINIQHQVECIMELGIEEAINNNLVKTTALPHIKNFLQQIQDNAYFGDASTQAFDAIALIEDFELKNPTIFNSQIN